MSSNWVKIKKILNPYDPKVTWLGSNCGASFVLPTKDKKIYDLFVTGRDKNNYSQIGKLKLDFSGIKKINVIHDGNSIFFTKGAKGSFDEHGVAYPWFLKKNDGMLMYYVGWKKRPDIPFINNIGIAEYKNGTVKRLCKNFIKIKNENSNFGIGSCAVDKKNNEYLMWYTCFKKWKWIDGNWHPRYIINIAKSIDGINWKKEADNIFQQNYKNFCQCRPTFLKNNNGYEIWFSARGEDYKIYKSKSNDGLVWSGEVLDISLSKEGWDSTGMAYPYVFMHENNTYMIYSGNKYGKGGLGIAKRMLIQ